MTTHHIATRTSEPQPIGTDPIGALPGPAFRIVVLATLTIVAVTVTLRPGDAVAIPAVLLVFALLGLPHGAVDHEVAASLANSDQPPDRQRAKRAVDSFQLRFHLAYLGAFAGYCLAWVLAPPAALLVFLITAIHHFGQSDLAYLRLRAVDQLPLQLSRGLLIVALPLVAHIDDVATIIDRMTGWNPSTWTSLTDYSSLWAIAIVIQHVAVGVWTSSRLGDRSTMRREVITAISLGILFVATPPLIGFAVYFGLWHSLNHLFVLRSVLGRSTTTGMLSFSALARLAAPRSVLSIIALGSLAAVSVNDGRRDLVIPFAFVLVSALTLPHMFVVERMWRRRLA